MEEKLGKRVKICMKKIFIENLKLKPQLKFEEISRITFPLSLNL